MTQTARILALCLALAPAFAAPASAACYVEYKAKQDNPLRLHYGILRLDSAACPGRDAAARSAADRLARAGWQLLNVVGLSEDDPGDNKRANAGEHYLRY